MQQELATTPKPSLEDCHKLVKNAPVWDSPNRASCSETTRKRSASMITALFTGDCRCAISRVGDNQRGD